MTEALSDLRSRREKLVRQARQLVNDAKGASRDLSETEQDLFDDLTTRAKGLEIDIARNERLLELEKATLDGRAHDPATASGDFARECRQFSIRKALLAALDVPGKPRNLDAGREREIQQLAVRQVGARFLTGLQGDIEIPRLATGAATAYVAEDGDFVETTPTTDEITMSPKFIGGIVSMTWKMLLQSSPAVESLVRDDLTATIAREIDRAVIQGAGGTQPAGLVGNAGIPVVTGTGALTWDNVLAFREVTELANAAPSGWLANPRSRRKLRGTEKFTGTSGEPIMTSPSQLDGLPFVASTLVPDNLGAGTNEVALLMGDFGDLLVGTWSDIEILANPYRDTDYKKARLSLRATAAMDSAIRRNASFAKRVNLPR